MFVVNENFIRNCPILVNQSIKLPAKIRIMNKPDCFVNETGTTKHIFYFHIFLTKKLKKQNYNKLSHNYSFYVSHLLKN